MSTPEACLREELALAVGAETLAADLLRSRPGQQVHTLVHRLQRLPHHRPAGRVDHRISERSAQDAALCAQLASFIDT
ncbi:hypothetical protein HBDW_16100 [Herbaspirillum sp. DW155]|uniref:hypothetical protein n=1 Tax=Herbaspirillum sp. DW155 TaxID=3095609 RepID=UPI00308AA7B2|nr:hypothetical protein HBDW_16100 [Herbaspirillum sp. DW155]